MKFKLPGILSLIFLFGLGVLQLQSQTFFLDINRWDGTDKSVELAALKKITFSDTDIILNYQIGSSENYATSSIRKIIFGSYNGLKETINNTNSILIYPNPSSDYITLKNKPEGDLNFNMYSISGTQVMNILHYSGNEPIDVSRIKEGIYIIKIGLVSTKVVW